jgi:hypothetical protein
MAIGRLAAIGAAAYLCGAQPAAGQVTRLWSYAELLDEADMVVIVDWQSTTDTGREVCDPGITAGYPAVEVETLVEVRAVLKRPALPLTIGEALHLRHYRRNVARMQKQAVPGTPAGIVNGGGTVTFEKSGEYLLFLRSGAEGKYEPLSGHNAPGDSVFRLTRARQS